MGAWIGSLDRLSRQLPACLVGVEVLDSGPSLRFGARISVELRCVGSYGIRTGDGAWAVVSASDYLDECRVKGPWSASRRRAIRMNRLEDLGCVLSGSSM